MSFANTAILPPLGEALGVPTTTGANGQTYGLGNPINPDAQTFGEVVQNGFAKLVVDTPIRAGIQSLAGRGSFESLLLANLRSGAATDLIQPALFYGVGELGVLDDPAARALFGEGTAGKVLLHAAAGAAGGYLIGGWKGAIGGAIGAGLSEALTPAWSKLDRDQQQSLVQVIGGFGSLVAGDATMAGSVSALNGLRFNSRIHPDQTDRIKQLANGDSEKELKLTKAACALMHCADGVNPNDPNYARLKSMQDEGSQDDASLALLRQQRTTGIILILEDNEYKEVTYSKLLFQYGADDQAIDACTSGTSCTRAVGAATAIGGAVGVVGAVSAGLTSCAETLGIGCVAAGVAGGISADYVQAGARQAATGEWVTPYGQQVMESLGLSPGAAALIYGGMGIVAGEAAGTIAKGTTATSVTLPEVSVAEAVDNANTKPRWLQNFDAGNQFNADQASNYPYNEVYVNKLERGGYYWLDYYSPNLGEIVSRKHTQLSDIQESTAVGYIYEISSKYPVGATVANVPSSGNLAGTTLQGQYILEVPIQAKPIPQGVLDAAQKAGVIIRDSSGHTYP